MQKQKINGRISTEAKIEGADDALPQSLWFIYFIEGQGYIAEELNSLQDNTIAMLMNNNGKESSKKRTKHI